MQQWKELKGVCCTNTKLYCKFKVPKFRRKNTLNANSKYERYLSHQQQNEAIHNYTANFSIEYFTVEFNWVQTALKNEAKQKKETSGSTYKQEIIKKFLQFCTFIAYKLANNTAVCAILWHGILWIF